MHETKRSMNNFILFCKGWYHSDADLKTKLNLVCNMDNYGPGNDYQRSWKGINEILMHHFDELNELYRENGKPYLKTSDFVSRVREKMEYTKESYDYCIALVIIGFVAGLTVKNFLMVDKPVYSKKLSKLGFVYPDSKKGMTYLEQNYNALKIFKDDFQIKNKFSMWTHYMHRTDGFKSFVTVPPEFMAVELLKNPTKVTHELLVHNGFDEKDALILDDKKSKAITYNENEKKLRIYEKEDKSQDYMVLEFSDIEYLHDFQTILNAFSINKKMKTLL